MFSDGGFLILGPMGKMQLWFPSAAKEESKLLAPLTKGLFWVKASENGSFPYCNCLWVNTDMRVLIDTNPGQEDLPGLIAAHPEVVINTHFHEDHVTNNSCFNDTEFWAAAADVPAIESVQGFMDYYGFADYQLEKLGCRFLQEWHINPVRVARKLHADEILDFGWLKLQVIALPGHTPGHIGFWEEKTGLLYSTDVDLSKYGPWYGHKCSDLGDFAASLQLCLDLAPARLLSAHSRMYEDKIAFRLQRFLDIIYQREEQVLVHLRAGASTPEDLTGRGIIYGAQVKRTAYVDFTEKIALIKHLDWLLAKGIIRKQAEHYFIA